MSQPDAHQQSLLKAAKNGDDDALGELIENFRSLLRADAQRTMRDVQGRVDASDVVQMTWWSAFRAFPRFTGDVDAFVGWLRKIHERNLRDAVRDQHAEKRAIDREVALSAVLPNAAARLTTPSQGFVRQEQQEQINACLALLPPAQKEALWLRFYQGLSVAEIVEHMGRSETAIAGLLKRGLSNLRTMMQDQTQE
jgi:RNA polymerase sigma-70 factor, ECF subfamily